MKKIKIKSILEKIFKKKVNINNYEIKNFSSIENPKSNSVSFCEDLSKFNKKKIKNCLIFSKISKKLTNNVIFMKVADPRYSFFKFYKSYEKLKKKKLNSFYIHKNVYIGDNVKFLDKKKIYVGKNVILKNCTIGKNCIIQDNSVIGNDGYGYFKHKNKKYKQAHFGKVIIEDNVDIGPLTNIERGHFDNTILRTNSKIDALVQIGHNCVIGKNSNICAGSILSGNVKIGDDVWVGPKSSFKEKITIGNNTIVGIGSNVLKNIDKNLVIYGNPAEKKC